MKSERSRGTGRLSIGTSWPAALVRENLLLVQHLGNALLEAQRSWLDLGMSQLGARVLCAPPTPHADGTSGQDDSPAVWHWGWACESALESIAAIQNVLATDVGEAWIEWQQACALSLGAPAASPEPESGTAAGTPAAVAGAAVSAMP